MKKTGSIDLPLHYGKAPPWLFERMVKLSGEIAEIIVDSYGKNEFLRRISDPLFFQAFSLAVGFDWHSSGTTTVLIGALKEYLKNKDIGLAIAGGKALAGLKTPEDIEIISKRYDLKNRDKLIYSSKISARVDNNLIQDGFSIYFHSMIITDEGKWAVVQQGLNYNEKYARRYHWLGENVKEYVNEPHSGIVSDISFERVLDLTSSESEETRKTTLEIVKDNPLKIKNDVVTIKKNMLTIDDFTDQRVIKMPWKINWDVLREIYEFQPKNYEDIVMFKGMGASTIRALAYIATLIYGSRVSWKDPVKYSFALGGKDGVPRPVDRKAYDESIDFLKNIIDGLDSQERKDALRRIMKLVP